MRVASHAGGDHNHLVFQFDCITSRRFTADISYCAGNQDSVDRELVELRPQIALARKNALAPDFQARISPSLASSSGHSFVPSPPGNPFSKYLLAKSHPRIEAKCLGMTSI